MRSAFRDLTAYVRAEELANRLHRDVPKWPQFQRLTLGMQLVRAADSIGANIAEASGRASAADRKRFLVIARGSLHETEHWLAKAGALGLVSERAEDALDEIARTLSGLIAKQR